MKAVVIGGGLIGLSSAYFLSNLGHEVTVVDRNEGPALETSFANGSLLTPSMSAPWNAPGCWRVLLGSLFRPDAPLQLRLGTLPGLTSWGIQFLRNSGVAAFKRNSLSNLRLALYSSRVMRSLRHETGIDYGRVARGSLRIFRDESALERAFSESEPMSAEGLSFRKLSVDQTVETEAALVPIASQLAGAIHYADDETGNAYKFCVGLTNFLKQRVEFLFDTEVRGLEVSGNKVTALVSARQRLVADAYVVAAGSYSTSLLRSIGLSLPVQPAKGYSLTLDDYGSDARLMTPILDDEMHAVVVPLGNGIRVAGTAEFAGYNLEMNSARNDNLKKLLRQVLPQVRFDASQGKAWCGLRPMSVDGVPVIGATPIENLWLNTGHGHLGWTMAAGSGQLLSQLMCRDALAIDPTAFAFARFNAGG